MSTHSIEPQPHPEAHDGHDHGSYRSYLTGFVLSVILTVIPFAIVMTGGFESRAVTALVVIGFAVVQILVHMVYFLHMNSKSDEGWTMLSMIFTVIVVVIMLAGSLWVMFNLNANMMPQMNHGDAPAAETQGFGS
ncbi:cytochrome o ubiquinol oxidase subunit IV [Ensifer soli]|uniref:cytochrome o ubiquinol oxidase subunit IV n=1 Tax=Ciceribacter sp. sgz301302 TaxID=3342379 RepID=UPI0035B7608A